MFNGRFRSSFCTVGLALCFALTAHAQVNVTTWHNDGARDGANTNETQLTPANVGGQGTFGQLFSVPLDGAVSAQPLYVAGLTIAGGTHNVVFAATENDSLYAIDADTGSILWQRSFLGSGMTAVPSSQEDCSDIKPEIGITGTPVIDTTTNTLYVVSATMPGPIQQLHAIDLLTGNDKLGGPVTISASVTGTGTGGNGTTVPFNAMTENQRSALLLTNGHVVIAWGSHCDHGSFHGWLMSYNATSLAQETVLNTTPNGNDGGIWMSGAAPAVDAQGNIFFSSGNGDFGGPTVTEFGDSTFKMPQPVAGQSWEPVDGFAPWNQASLSGSNYDVGGGGVVLLPDLPTGATHQQLSIQSSKNGEIYVLDRNNMGGYCSTCTSINTNIAQDIEWQLRNDTLATPAYWNGTIYFGDTANALKAFSFNTTTGAVSSTPKQSGTYIFGSVATTPSISSNGNSDGIVWVIDSAATSGAVLLAYDATNLNNVLYQYSLNQPGTHFAVPTVTNGKVYVGSQTGLTAFGLLNAPAVLTITASNVSVPYGQPIPALTGYTATGFVNGDNSSVLSGAPVETTTATQNSPAGTYPITITQGTLAAQNYTFTFVNGTLTITGGQSQTITFPTLQNTTYGAAAVPLTATASSGLPVSYTVTGPASLSGSSLNITGAGAVTVTASQSGNSSYTAATPVSRSFTVSQAPLTVTAANVSVAYNQAIPALIGYTATGFVNGDTSAVLSGVPTETTTATQGSPAGTYPISITQGSLTAANYTFTFASGTLTITAGSPTAPPVSLQFSPNPIPPNTASSYSVSVGSGVAGQPNPVGTITLYGILSTGQVVQADGPHPIGTAGTAGVSTFSNTLPAGIPSGQYTLYATFQPGSGTTYLTASSPHIVVVAQ